MFQVMIPLSLYVTLEMAKLLQVYHIHNDVEMYDPETNKRIECRALNITEELGQVKTLIVCLHACILWNFNLWCFYIYVILKHMRKEKNRTVEKYNENRNK